MIKHRQQRAIILTMLVGLLGVVLSAATAAQEFKQFRVVGYYHFYNVYDDYLLTDVPTEHLTHLIYAHVEVSDAGQCVSPDTWADTGFRYPGDGENERLRGNFKRLQMIKEDNPDIKIMMSIGGWDYSDKFSEIADDANARIRFARSCVTYMREYEFDGIDIDWRFPVEGGATPGLTADYDNFPLLLAEFDGQFQYWEEREEDQDYVLSITSGAVPDFMQNYQYELINEYVDFINVLSFAYEGEWSGLASHQAPLYVSERDPRNAEAQADYTVNGTVSALLDVGIPAGKIVPGIAFQGQSWRNVAPNDFFGMFSPSGGIPNGTRPGGVLYYSDLVSFLESDNYTRYFDESAGVPWMYNEDARVAISYENEASIRAKANYIRRMNLGGAMVPQLAYDDTNHTLLETLAETLNGVR